MYKFAIKTLLGPRNKSDALQTPFSSQSNLIHVYFERSSWLTFWTGAWLDLLIGWLEKWAEDKRALLTVVFHHAELWKNACATCHDTTSSNQLVHVQLSAKKKKKTNKINKQHCVLPESIHTQTTPSPHPSLPLSEIRNPQGRGYRRILFHGE